MAGDTGARHLTALVRRTCGAGALAISGQSILEGQSRRSGSPGGLCRDCAGLGTNSGAAGSVKLNTWVSPSSGISGTSLIWVTGSGFPSGTIDAAVSLDLQTSCGVTTGETAATATAVSDPSLVQPRRSSFRFRRQSPAGLLCDAERKNDWRDGFLKQQLFRDHRAACPILRTGIFSARDLILTPQLLIPARTTTKHTV